METVEYIHHFSEFFSVKGSREIVCELELEGAVESRDLWFWFLS